MSNSMMRTHESWGKAQYEVRINIIRGLIQENQKRGGVAKSGWECANSSPSPEVRERRRSILLGRETDTPHMPLAFPRNVVLLRTFKAFSKTLS